MDKNFMKELDSLKSLDDLLDNPKHLETLNFSQPHDDYSNWQDKLTKVRLMNVKWDADKNVVNWKTTANRDAYFDRTDLKNTHDYTTQWNLLSLENFAPSLGAYQGNLIVDLPLEQALGYNYVAIDRYQQPVENDPDSIVRSRFFFFITGVKSEPVAPNTTNLIIELDAWTEYACEGFNTLAGDLERGHYAMDKITTDDYFKNPLDSPVNLFEDEPTLPRVKNKVSYESMTTVYDDPVIVLGSTMRFMDNYPYSDFAKHDLEEYWWLDYQRYLDKYAVDSSTTDGFAREVTSSVTNNDKPDWDVDGGKPVSQATQSLINGTDQNITNIHYYVLEISDWENMLDILRKQYPQVFDTLKVVFILPRRYIKLGQQFTSTFGVPMQYAMQQNTPQKQGTLTLTPDMFGYKESDYTKLYTAQFSEIEISNMNGSRATFGIEDTAGHLDFMFRANIMFPFLKFEGFVNGIGGSLINSYKLKPLNERDYPGYVSKWEELHTEFNIPTYGIYQDAKTFSWREGQALQRQAAIAALRYNQGKNNIAKEKANGKNTIDAAYNTGDNSATQARDNGNRSNEAALANALESADTTKTNGNASNDTSFSNAKEIAATTRDNSTRSNDTALQNALDSATNVKTTATNSATTSKETSDETAELAKDTGTNSANTDYDIAERNRQLSVDNTNANLTKVSDDFNTEQERLKANSDLAIELNALGAVAGIAVSTVNGNIVSTPSGGGGDAVGALNKAGIVALDTAQTAGSTENQSNFEKGSNKNTNKYITTTRDNSSTAAQSNNDENKATSLKNINLSYSTAIKINQQVFDTAKENITDNYNTSTTNAQRSHDTTATNIGASYKTSIDVATANHTTTADNIGREYTKEVDNAQRTYAAAKANISGTYATTEKNLTINKENATANLNNDLDNAQTNNLSDYMAARANISNNYAQALNRPTQVVTENTGDGSLDAWGRRGFEVRANRISQADETTVTNEFSRFGYYMPANTWIQSPTFDPIQSPNHPRHFSYWKFRDIMSWSTEMSETSKRVIIELLENGVTIYDKPENVNAGLI